MRTKKANTRQVEKDVKYGSTLIQRLINRSMKYGKKSVAQKQVYAALDIIAKDTKRKALEVLEEGLDKIKPKMEVRTRRVGGASYQVPMPVRDLRARSLSIRWLVNEANKRPNKQYHTFADKLAAEILDALQEQGGAIEKRNTSHRMAEANKAFSHFRW